jgi:choline dehydrogenase-like flavoprotein
VIAVDPRSGPLELRARTCVIGSGAGGAVAAAELAAGGVDALLLEEGPHHDPAAFDQREATMMDRLYMEGGQRLTADQAIAIVQGRGLGGSTVHNTALCVPPPRAILERWARLGALPEPLPRIEAVAAEILARAGAAPPDPASVNRNNRLLEDGARRLGLRSEVPLHNRASCSGCGYCILGCAYNRKRHVVFSHLEPAVAVGLRIATGARVDRIRRSASGFRLHGPGFVADCDTVVVAASALGTPALLLRSGLGERRLIGRSLRIHPFAPVAAVFDEPVEAWRGIPQSLLVTADARFLDGGEGGWILMAAAAGPAATAAFIPGCGPEVTEGMKRYARLAVAGVLLHDEGAGTVRARRDGLPSVRYWPSEPDRRGLMAGIDRLARLWFAAGARRVLLPFGRLPAVGAPEHLRVLDRIRFRRHDVVLNSVHPQGSVPMGGDPRRHAVTPEGGLRGARGVYVADASIFPTSVGVPPQITIMTLATLIARGLAARGGARP